LKKYLGGFVLYNKYSRKDVFRILNWDKNPLAQNVGGYMFNPERTNCAIFVNYHKEDGISSTTNYEEVFLNKLEFLCSVLRILLTPSKKWQSNRRTRLKTKPHLDLS
jgi:hypothetical protein